MAGLELRLVCREYSFSQIIYLIEIQYTICAKDPQMRKNAADVED